MARLDGDAGTVTRPATVEDAESGERKTYTIVGDDEGDLKKGRISIQSPMARALITKSVGDTATVRSPKGNREVFLRAEDDDA